MGCPTDETLAAWLDGRLDAGAAQGVEAHVADCPTCLEVIATAARVLGALDGSAAPEDGVPPTAQDRGTSWARYRDWRLLAAVAAGLVAVIGVAGLLPSQSRVGRDGMLSEIGASRTTVARVVGQRHGAEPVTFRGDASSIPPVVIQATGKLLAQIAGAETASSARDAGVAWLLLGDTDKAIAELTFALDHDEAGEPAVAADLAAAHVERGRRQNRPADFAQAADLILRYDAEGAVLPDEAYFNRALALEYLGFRDAARDAWTSYLRRDADSAWSVEARRRRDALGPAAGRTESAPPQRGRLWLQDVALPALAEAILASNGVTPTVQAQIVALLEHGADGLHLSARDRSYFASWLSPRTGDAVGVARTIAAFGRMRTAYERDAQTSSAAEIARALASAPAPSYVTGWALLHRSLEAYGEGRLDEAVALATDAALHADAAADQALSGRLFRVFAVVALRRMELTSARLAYLRARDALEQSDDRDALVATYASLAEVHDLLREHEQAWEWHRRAVQSSHLLGSGRRRHAVLAASAWSCYRQRLFGLGAVVAEALVVHADDWGAAVSRTEARIVAARILAEAGDLARARAHLASAAALLPAVAEPAYRTRLSALLGAARMVSDLRVGSDSVSTIEDDLATDDADLVTPDVLIEAGLFAYRQRRPLDAARLATRALEVVVRHTSTEARQARLAFRDFYGDARRLLADALLASDPTGRTLMASIGPSAPPPTAIPVAPAFDGTDAPAHALVVFEEGINTLHRLIVHRGEIEVASLPTRTVDVLRQQLLREVHAEGRDAGHAARRLGDLLLADVFDALPEVEHLTIVPGARLRAVPLAALHVGGQWVVDRATVTLTARVSSPPRSATNRPRRSFLGLVSRGADGMPVLPAAEAEVRAAGARYDTRTIRPLGHPGALHERADVVHVVTHALVDPSTGVGTLVDGSGRDADLLASVLRSRPDVVVLSACSTGVGRTYSSGEGESVAARLLHAGVPLVVSSLWPVPDGALTDFWAGFHDALRHGASPAEALQRAQRALITRGAPARLWAAFAVER
jgi:hypothetical protein